MPRENFYVYVSILMVGAFLYVKAPQAPVVDKDNLRGQEANAGIVAPIVEFEDQKKPDHATDVDEKFVPRATNTAASRELLLNQLQEDAPSLSDEDYDDDDDDFAWSSDDSGDDDDGDYASRVAWRQEILHEVLQQDIYYDDDLATPLTESETIEAFENLCWVIFIIFVCCGQEVMWRRHPLRHQREVSTSVRGLRRQDNCQDKVTEEGSRLLPCNDSRSDVPVRTLYV